MKDYLVRFAQVHESFRRAELAALAELASVELRVLLYDPDSPFCIVQLPSDAAAKQFFRRSILGNSIYELWGAGPDYDALRASVRTNQSVDPLLYKEASFRFAIDAYRGKRTSAQQRELIESFTYLGFDGPIVMNNPEVEMCIFEDYDWMGPAPKRVLLGRFLAASNRSAILKYDLKRRSYISRTSMDAELSLVTALLTLAAPGKIIYDPFVGTGSFSVACAHLGAMNLGSDIDGRSFRGSGSRSLVSNFEQYGTASKYLDSFTSDLNHTPLRQARVLDGIICDPPYGVREGPKTLGYREGKEAKLVMIDGVPAHYRDGWVPPKRPYSFDDMMQDVLDFAFVMLVDHGRLSVWMPTANDEDVELSVPLHPGLDLVSTCVQDFNKWSRRLLTYRRKPDADIDPTKLASLSRHREVWGNADQLNRFREKYFKGFPEYQRASSQAS